jgi:hypothetical protein
MDFAGFVAKNDLKSSGAKPSSRAETKAYSDDEDDEEDIARNLLGFRDSRNWNTAIVNPRSPDHSSEPAITASAVRPENTITKPNNDNYVATNHLSTASILEYYEPKFLEIFTTYVKSTGKTVDINSHFLSMCLEHVIPFNVWARESNSRLAWIRSVLDDNPDLRPEVRNGLSMIYIYAFSAGKAAVKAGADMFSVIQVDSCKNSFVTSITEYLGYN